MRLQLVKLDIVVSTYLQKGIFWSLQFTNNIKHEIFYEIVENNKKKTTTKLFAVKISISKIRTYKIQNCTQKGEQNAGTFFFAQKNVLKTIYMFVINFHIIKHQILSNYASIDCIKRYFGEKNKN